MQRLPKKRLVCLISLTLSVTRHRNRFPFVLDVDDEQEES